MRAVHLELGAVGTDWAEDVHRSGQISQSPSREDMVKRAGDRGQEAPGAVQEGVERLGRARVLGGRPVVYVARLGRVADHGPGRLLTLEAKPERERSVGVVGNVPDLVLATAEQWALSLDGEAPERIRGRWLGVIHGPVYGELYLSKANARILGEFSGADAGAVVAGAGDVNADSFNDLLISALESDEDGTDSGTVWLFLGPVSGGTSLITSAQARFDGATDYDQVGHSISGPGDVNGDGYSDVLIGAPWASSGDHRGNVGGAYLIWGSP